jgi:hypothetical protein
MIDLGEYWWNGKPTSYSHAADNVYRKAVNVRNYMSDMARAHPGFQMLTTCETENPHGTSDQCVSLILIGENGQAGAYKRTDGAAGFADIQANLRDAVNYIGLMPLESCVQVHGEDAHEPWPEMFTPRACYASLLGGCSTYYSDVRRWTPEQRKFLRQFNEWRKSPSIAALLREVAHPLAIGADNLGPYAWIYTNADRSRALLIAVGFDATPADLSPRLRTLAADKTYIIEEVTQPRSGPTARRPCGTFSGAKLKTAGFPIHLKSGQERCAAFIIQEANGSAARVCLTRRCRAMLPVFDLVLAKAASDLEPIGRDQT